MTANASRERRTQSDRSSEMRARLVRATVESLVESGYARTTTVEVCRRAGVTRGALHHHFADLPDLLVAAMSDTYERFFLAPARTRPFASLEAWIDDAWARLRQPEFKAVIEVWLAARNEPALGDELRPAIERYKQVFSIEASARLRALFGSSPEVQAFYRLACETLIGLALGRATTPGGRAVDHEAIVIGMLKSMARRIVRKPQRKVRVCVRKPAFLTPRGNAPISAAHFPGFSAMASAFDRIKSDIDANDIVLFMKGTPGMPQCGFSATVVHILDHMGVKYKGVNVLADPEIRQGIKDFSNWPTIPQLYVKGEFVGGCDIIREMFESGELRPFMEEKGIKAEAP